MLLEQQKKLIEESNEINRVQINHIATKLSLLEDRISLARIVDLSTQPRKEIHFGATITLFKQEVNCKCQYGIVGIDEANVFQNEISFLSPMAKALRNKNAGDTVALQTPLGKRNMKIKLIEY